MLCLHALNPCYNDVVQYEIAIYCESLSDQKICITGSNMLCYVSNTVDLFTLELTQYVSEPLIGKHLS